MRHSELRPDDETEYVQIAEPEPSKDPDHGETAENGVRGFATTQHLVIAEHGGPWPDSDVTLLPREEELEALEDLIEEFRTRAPELEGPEPSLDVEDEDLETVAKDLEEVGEWYIGVAIRAPGGLPHEGPVVVAGKGFESDPTGLMSVPSDAQVEAVADSLDGEDLSEAIDKVTVEVREDLEERDTQRNAAVAAVEGWEP
ncbi:hypothetical protein [Natronococcus roseus]|uniref:hypothetical protein n=1 Tax=Natronococcus roseus TaxID=1052014 RepID=UPI00374D58B7